MRYLAIGLSLGLAGCGVVRGFGGQELGMEDQAPESNPADLGEDPVASAIEASCYDTGSMDRGVTATGIEGGVEIADLGYSGNCCAEWSASAEVTGDFALSVTYGDAAEACDCACPWGLHYTITPLASGDWTIDVAGETVTATVP